MNLDPSAALAQAQSGEIFGRVTDQSGAVVPGLALLVLFVVEQAVFVPLIVARSQRQKSAPSDRHRVP